MSAALADIFDPSRRVVTDLVVLELPEPPSVNALFANVSVARRERARRYGRSLPGRMKSQAYLTWINAAGWLIQAQRPGRISGRYEITISAGPTRKDLANLEKALGDLMQTHGIIENDRLADRVTIERDPDLKPRTVRVLIRPAEPA
ncbi:RusA family crossover junction endodeoxyribonuclease [uncultured Enterovirga sp.]|uniref:RusA family crossover junction endodeoxyribonuclease n=1 Tax=uncultured Enterovirga sp. TaxID=2026352 RepID=UPI0035CB625D